MGGEHRDLETRIGRGKQHQHQLAWVDAWTPRNFGELEFLVLRENPRVCGTEARGEFSQSNGKRAKIDRLDGVTWRFRLANRSTVRPF